MRNPTQLPSLLLTTVLLIAASTGLAQPTVSVTAAIDEGHEHGAQCSLLDPEQSQAFQQRMAGISARPMPRPPSGGASLQDFGPVGPDDPFAGMVPADYVSPVELVRQEGHLRHEIEVHLPALNGKNRLQQVLSFDAPDWARMMLVEFVPDTPAEEQANAGLFLRPHNPFLSATFPETDSPFDLPELEVDAFAQAAYRSENAILLSGEPSGMSQYVLVTRDMDPAPAGKPWHVAIGQMRDDRALSGTLTVRFSGSTYRAPVALQLFYDVEEEAQEVGFFDPTPREPNGDNPGRTQGEAMRWILFKAAEELLEQLDFDGFLPVRVLVTTDDSSSGEVGLAGGLMSVKISPEAPAPGRLRSRPAGAFQMLNGALQRLHYSVPAIAYEREAGTDACRARTTIHGTGMCRPGNSEFLGEELRNSPGAVSAVFGYIQIRRDFVLPDGPNAGEFWRWDKNLKDRTGRPNIVSLIKHELMHVLGFSGPITSQAYVATFEPPRPFLDRPVPSTEEHDGVWTATGARTHFYGPITSPSPHNPWAHTHEPGPRLEDTRPQSAYSHLMFDEGDELASWAPNKDFMRQIQIARQPQEEVGIARDMLLDLGYARGTWSIQDRRLPRHWFDPDRSGHGLDFRRVERADGSMLHFLHFYTYDSGGNPEWYIATAELDDRMVFEGTLDYVTWDESRSPVAEVDPSRSGTIRLDLDPPIDHPACAQRRSYHPSGNDKWLFAVLDFDLPDGTGTWCLEPLQFGREPAFPHEGSGSWFSDDPADSGWGLSVMTRNYGPRPIINTVVYYYDAAGEPTWSIGTGGGDYSLPYGSIASGVDIEMLHVHGFCRTCEPVATPVEPAGVMRIRISEQATESHSGNRIEWLDLNDRGPAGGHWSRENVGIRLLSSPHPNMSQ